VLERAGLITRTREAQWRPAQLDAAPLAAAVHWLESYRSSEAYDPGIVYLTYRCA
jgi:hypothetical protein